MRRRFKSKKAWAGPGMTWIVHYNKQSDSVVHDIVKSEFKSEPIALASVPDDTAADGESSGDNDHDGHQWIMDTGCGSDFISKAKVEAHNLRRSKAKNPIQFQTANGNTKGLDVVTMNIVSLMRASNRMFSRTHPLFFRLVEGVCRRDTTLFGYLANIRTLSHLVVSLLPSQLKMTSHTTFLGIQGVNQLSPRMSCLSRA